MNKFQLFVIYFLYFCIKSFQLFPGNGGGPSIKVFDIGQGDAIWITTPNAKHILIDGGPDFEVDSLVFKDLTFKCYIEAIVLTHPHKDHLQGLTRLLERCSVQNIYVNPTNYPSSDYKRFLDMTSQISRHHLIAGDVLNIDGLKFYVLWPESFLVEKPPSNANLLSIVLLMDYNNLEALFTGDLEKPYIQGLVNSPFLNKVDGRLEFYKVSHHGSHTGLSTDLISKLNPVIAVISCGVGNSYHHPHKQVLDFFSKTSTHLFRTDLSGTLEFHLNNLPK